MMIQPTFEQMQAFLGLPELTEEDQLREADIRNVAELYIDAESDEERRCAADTIERLVKQRSDAQILKCEMDRYRSTHHE